MILNNILIQPFGQRLNTPLLIDLDSDKKKPIAEHGEEATIEVYTAGICHQTIFGTELLRL